MDTKKITEFLNNKNNKLILIIILVGVSFMLFCDGGEKREEIKKDISVPVSDEKRLEEILSKINGVGKVSVMITYEATPEYDIAYEVNESKTQRDDNNEITKDTSAVLSSGEPFVKRSIYPEIKGVLVVIGRGDSFIKREVQNAVSTAIGVAIHKVCVMEGNQS